MKGDWNMKEILFREAEYIKEDGVNGIILIAEDGMLFLRSPEQDRGPGNWMGCDPVMKDTPENRKKLLNEAKRMVKDLKKVE